MRLRKWGRVINILNTGAKAPPAEGAPTAVTRAAGMALTGALHEDALADFADAHGGGDREARLRIMRDEY